MRKIPKNHILIVVDTLKMGGSARQATQLAISLAKKKFYVDIFFYKHNFNDIFYKEILLNKYINVFYLQKPKFSNGFSLKLLFDIFNLIKRNDYRTLISFQLNPTIYLALAAFLNPRKKCKKIFSLRNSPSLISNKQFFIIFLLTFYFNKLVLNSNKLRNFFVSRNILFSKFFIKNTITIMNGYSNTVSYESLNIRKNPSRILILARVHPVKGGIRFAKGMKLFLQRNNKSISIKWAGSKEDNFLSNIEFQTINNIINSSPRLKDSWEWAGQIEDVNSLYKWTDVVIVPSSSEGMSNVVCEALCRGKFIISSDVGDYEFLIGENKGIVYGNSSAKSLCKAIEKFFEIGHKKRTQISKNGLTFAKENLLLEGVTNKYIELF